MDQGKTRSQGDIVPPRQFPYCIVWTPIPLISWLLPFVGHMGVCSSKGTIMVSQRLPYSLIESIRSLQRSRMKG